MNDSSSTDSSAEALKERNPTGIYGGVLGTVSPIIKGWGRLQVSGLETLPPTGPVLLVGNHDSYWDPLSVGVAAKSVRPIQALAKSTLWKTKPLGFVMDGMGQIPIVRGGSDSNALAAAIHALENGSCIGVFPEGTISRGSQLRARSGAGRLALAVPESKLMCVAIKGTVDIVRAPKRPLIEIEFFEPESGQLKPGESANDVIQRLMAEVREKAPVVIPGRKKTAAKYTAKVAAEKAQAQSEAAQAEKVPAEN